MALFSKDALNPGVYMGTAPCTLRGVNYPVCSVVSNTNARRVFSQVSAEAAEKLADKPVLLLFGQLDPVRFVGNRSSGRMGFALAGEAASRGAAVTVIAANVALPRELDGVSARVARAEAARALEEVGIAELADRFPDDMSGGQQQRVAIARAVVGERRLTLAMQTVICRRPA